MAHRPFFSRLPVRVTAVALLLGVLVLPLLTEIRRRAVEQLIFDGAEKQALVATAAVVAEINAVQQTVERLLRYVAADLESRGEVTPQAIDQVLRNMMAVGPNLAGCTVCFEPQGLNAATERFGPHLRRTSSGVAVADLAAQDEQYWTKEWYRDALQAKNVVWSEPFRDGTVAKKNLVWAAMPYFRTINGRRVVVGVVASAIELNWLKQVALRHLPFETGFVMIFSRSGRLLLHPREELIIAETMDSLAKSTNTPELAQIRQQVLAKRQGALAYFSGALNKRVRVNYKPSWGSRGGGVIVGFEEAEFTSELSKFRTITLLSLAATLAVFIAIVAGASFFVLRPLGQLTQAAEQVAAGDLDGKLPAVRRDDEVGRLTRVIAALRDKLRAK
jgi:sigma-B regulation protein RsbU (phosphoserine phosphatase)